MEDFVHLHVHTQYSLLDGQSSVPKLVDKALKDGMRGVAVTDHGNMMGIKEFFNYVKKKKGGAKDSLTEAKERLAALADSEYHPDKDNPSQKDDVGKTAEELQAKYEAQMKKAQYVLSFKPIFGCEMYVARNGMLSKSGKEDQSGWHLVVLAKNEKGYHNLLKLVSRAWTQGYYYRPRTEHAELERYHEGLIVCSACLAGEVPSAILNNDIEKAERAIEFYKGVFGDDFYLELQRHEVKRPEQRANRETFVLQEKVNKVLLELAKKHDVKLVCTNDCHFIDEENAEAHDRLICMSTQKDLDDPTRMLYSKQEWVKTRAEMNEVFADVPEALRNTCEVCDKVEEYSIDHGPIMPNFDIPVEFGTEEEYRQRFTEEDLFNEFTRDENGNVVCSEEEGRAKIAKLGGYDKLYRIKLEADYLRKLSYEGAKHFYGDPLPQEVDERINFELHVMKTMGFPGYFLIVQDYINVARKELGVSVGPGRGSAAGSAVAYCLGITQIDPIKYDLLFERFLNPDRISLPDIDVDFDDDGRGRVLQWVTKKYGAEKVAHIITYSTLATKSAISSVARVEKLPLARSQELVKAIPDRLPEGPDGKVPKMNLANAIAAVPELQAAEESSDPLLRDTMRYARMLEGNIRGTGVHACGTIICRDDITDWVPVSTADDKETGEKVLCTQYEGSVIEETGLIKMDFLGLKNLSIMRDAVDNIRESLGLEVDLEKIDISDPATYQLYGDGRTIGTFQFESPGMQKHLRNLQPTTFEDLIAMNALYRPGPMAYIPDFIDRKHGRQEIKYDLPCMERYLRDTYGITVYQEQVMLLSRLIADFTRGESDTLRKAMGKKQIDKLNHLYPKFIAGGKKNGHDEKILEKIWNDWRAFASYAFNKSHATCYSWVAYQTAYLKANYPAQYMAATMSRSLNDINEITKLMDECKSMGIETLGPDINESRIKFSVNSRNNIRFGLGAIKGVGAAAADLIVRERDANGPFKDIFDFIERIDLTVCNRRVLENFVQSGVFDGLGEMRREQYLLEFNQKGENFIEQLLRYGQTYQQDKASNMMSLFGDMAEFQITKPTIPPFKTEWSSLERLNRERDLIGIYLSAHPLDDYAVAMHVLCNHSCTELRWEYEPELTGEEWTVGGMVIDVREAVSQNNTPCGFVKVEDFKGVGELRFYEDWPAMRPYFTQGCAILMKIRLEKRMRWQKFARARVTEVRFLADVTKSDIKSLTVTVPLHFFESNASEDFYSLLKENQGEHQFFLNVYDAAAVGTPTLRLEAKRRININTRVLSYLKDNAEHLQFEIE